MDDDLTFWLKKCRHVEIRSLRALSINYATTRRTIDSRPFRAPHSVSVFRLLSIRLLDAENSSGAELDAPKTYTCSFEL